MARTYQTVGWEDGTILQPAKVTVAGTEYDVTPAVKSGTTPVNASNLRHMDNEIKKIVEEDIPGVLNVELIAVTDTAPIEFQEGDKYYNTEDNKVHTAIDNQGETEWDTGEYPVEGIMYIVYGEQTTYSYDGTQLVSVGGGSGSSDIVMVNEEPTEDTKLLIEDEDLEPQGLPIVNEYNNADNMAYSCDYVNEIVPYKMEIQTLNVTLQQNNWTAINITFEKTYNHIYYVLPIMFGGAKRTYLPSIQNLTTQGCTAYLYNIDTAATTQIQILIIGD